MLFWGILKASTRHAKNYGGVRDLTKDLIKTSGLYTKVIINVRQDNIGKLWSARACRRRRSVAKQPSSRTPRSRRRPPPSDVCRQRPKNTEQPQAPEHEMFILVLSSVHTISSQPLPQHLLKFMQAQYYFFVVMRSW